MEQHTLQNQLEEALSRTSKLVVRAYVTQLYDYLQLQDKETREITEEEMLAVVQLENISLSETPKSKQKVNRRNNKSTKAEIKTDEEDFPKTKDEGPPLIDRCGYVLRFGSKPGHYCNNKAEGKIFELEEGQRRFCERCVKGKNVVKDIVDGKSNTLEIHKGKPGNRRGKTKGNNNQEVPPTNKPGDFSSAVPGNATLQNLIPYMQIDDSDAGLFGILGSNHIVYRDEEGRIGLVATKTADGGLKPPSEESREWATENLVSIIDKPELFEEDEEIEEECEEEEEEEEEEEKHEKVSTSKYTPVENETPEDEEQEEQEQEEEAVEEQEEEEEEKQESSKIKSSFVVKNAKNKLQSGKSKFTPPSTKKTKKHENSEDDETPKMTKKSKLPGEKSKFAPNTKKHTSKSSKSGNALLEIPGQKKKM